MGDVQSVQILVKLTLVLFRQVVFNVVRVSVEEAAVGICCEPSVSVPH